MSSTKDSNTSSLRMRVFAGPNGSGKSTVINAIKQLKPGGAAIDFGIYINADEIAVGLATNSFSFSDYTLTNITKDKFSESCLSSGLVNESFPVDEYNLSFIIENNRLILVNHLRKDYIAQMLADFIRKQLIFEKKKFSFETVFSHESKLDIMKKASEAGYKVYLYFVSTASPEINKARVEARVKKGGHDVPADKIEVRYYKSLGLLYNATKIAYQAYFFDNSYDGSQASLFAHFKVTPSGKKWDPLENDKIPDWFIEYYYNKMKEE